MKLKASPVWIGALVAGSTAAFYFWQKKGALPAPALGAAPDTSGAGSSAASASPPRQENSANRTPTPENGHVRDVKATDLPAPDTGTNFTVDGDVHEPRS